MEKIEVTITGPGTYRVFSLYDKKGIAITSHGLLELATLIEANRATLEKEAEEEQQTKSDELFPPRTIHPVKPSETINEIPRVLNQVGWDLP